MALLTFIDLIVSSYALSKANQGESFVTQAFSASPPGIREALQQTFSCCGLVTYKDEYAAIPCPLGSDNSTTPCLEPMVQQFNAYGTGVPTFGLILFFLLLVVIILAWWLIRSIAAAIKESKIEML